MTKESAKLLPFSEEDWDKLRYQFQDSVMATTNLSKLAQNMGTKWPIRGKDETPHKYTGYTLEEMLELPEFFGKGNRLALLYSILKETQSFDDPFCEMVSQFDAEAMEENEALKSLKALGIPEDFPVVLANLSPETLVFCAAEDISRIDQLIEFSQRSAKAVIVGGEFRCFLNGLIQLDRMALKQYLPIRESEPGMFLAEALGQMAMRLSNEKAASLVKAYQVSVSKPSWIDAKSLPKNDTLDLIADLRHAVEQRFALMPNQTQQLRHAIETSEADCVRFFASLRDPDTEGLALAIAKAGLEVKPRFNVLSRRLLRK